MLRLDFHKPLTALEVRDPAIEVCKEVATEYGIFAKFHQNQQTALSGYSGQNKASRQRIGNGKHKVWFINFQEEPPQTNRPTVVGMIALKSPMRPDFMQFGGFDYGSHGETKPTYEYITAHTPSELEYRNPVDPNPEILAMVFKGLRDQFENKYPTLFPISDYVLE